MSRKKKECFIQEKATMDDWMVDSGYIFMIFWYVFTPCSIR